MSTATAPPLSPVERLAKLQRIEYLMRFHWNCGNPGCDGKPGCGGRRMPTGLIHPFPHARASQLPPPGDWIAWLLCQGRAAGKTRSAAEFVKGRMMREPRHRVGIIAPDFAVGKAVCLEGESGLVGPEPSDPSQGVIPPEAIKSYNRTTGELRLTNGSMVSVFGTNTQVDAEKIRGSQFHSLWFEESATQRYGELAWDTGLFALRLGKDPRAVITSTPRNTAIMRRLLKTEPGVVLTRGRTLDNVENLPPTIVRHLRDRYEGTSLGAQELEGELLEAVLGALWARELIDTERTPAPASLERVVVGVDPAGSHRKDSDETGIVVAGKIGECFHVLGDYSGVYTPDAWAEQVIHAYREHQADRVVAETNYGGDMVESTLRAKDRSVSYRKVTAARGKAVRAEPIVALYEQRRVHHPEPGFPTLEEQMCTWVPPGRFELDEKTGATIALPPSPWSPDRVDALVWALTDLSGRTVRYNHG